MSACCRIALFVLAVVGLGASSTAQEAKAKDESRIRVAISGTDHVRADVKYLVGLAPNQALNKLWAEIDETIAGFAEGVDTTTYAPHRRLRLVGHPDSQDAACACPAQ